jgi:heat shock protein 1/8
LDEQEGLAECIANEDGERQIACAISFHGEETVSFFFFRLCAFSFVIVYRIQYIGNEAKQQLVKNSANTIIGFRNLLGKKCVSVFLDLLPRTHPGAQVFRAPKRSPDVIGTGHPTPRHSGYTRVQSTSAIARTIPTLHRDPFSADPQIE